MTAGRANARDEARTGRVGRPPGPAPDPVLRRQELLDAAERVIARSGPDVSMDDIAAELGLTKPAVYRWLGAKAELTAALGERIGQRLRADLAKAVAEPGDIRAVVRAAVDVFCRFVEDQPHLYQFMVHAPPSQPIGDGLTGRRFVWSIATELETSIAAALEAAGGDPAVAATWSYAVLGAVFVAAEGWRSTGTVTRAELVEHLVDLLAPAFEHPPTARRGRRKTGARP